jgi:hypothetical protein
LLAQIVIGILVFWPRAAITSAEAGPLLQGFDAETVVSLNIADSDGNRVVLEKGSGGWVLPEAGDYPVNDETVSSLLEKIGNLETGRQVTRTESSHKRLKVAKDDFVRLVELELIDGETHTLYVGSSPRSSATHIRADDHPETYLAADLPSYEVSASANRWVDTQYYTVPQTATVALTLENENDEFEFERSGDDTWIMKGLAEDEKFGQITFNSLLGQVTSLRLVEPIGREAEDWFELDPASALVTLETDDGQVYTLRLGAKDEESNNYVAKWSESPYYVWVAEYTATSLLGKTRDDFIELPPTPLPEETEMTAPDESGGQ